ncbi:MAG TPA: FecR domain-containing protein [Dehalococcoidales bacterium]|nr:FecR domain-containing protein [Dehalococcoidales bacterium]
MPARFQPVFKRIFLASFSVLAGLSVLACGGTPRTPDLQPATNNPQVAAGATTLTVLTIAGGDVFVLKPGEKEWITGQPGMTLAVDYKIKAAANSTASITFFDGSTIEIMGDTEIELAELAKNQTTNTIRVKQTVGQTVSRVKKLADTASRYEVETPAAVAAVRGSIMFVAVTPDGVTTVGNLEGSISVTAQGVEVRLPENSRVNVVPGSAPEPPQPGAMPPSPTPTTPPAPATTAPATTPPAVSTPTPTTPAAITKITLASAPNAGQVFQGDIIVYTHTVRNEGNVPLTDVAFKDSFAGPTVYQSGDANSNQILDPGESWVYNKSYTTKASDVGQVTNNIELTAKGTNQESVSAVSFALVEITKVTVKLEIVSDSLMVGDSITINGTVNDPSIGEAVLTINDNPTTHRVINGVFSLKVTLGYGTYKIFATVNKGADIKVTYGIELVPVPVPEPAPAPGEPHGPYP